MGEEVKPVVLQQMPRPIEELYEEAIETLLGLIRRGFVFKIAFSAGKDSSACLALTINAMLRARDQGLPLKPLIVMHSDTLVESPAVRAHADEQFRLIEAYARRVGLDVRIRIARPRLTSTWQVRVLSGRATPTFANRPSRDCSRDLKVLPSQTLLRQLHTEIEKEDMGVPVTIIGTRLSESTSRGRRMSKRGDAGQLVEHRNQRGDLTGATLSLIAHWSTDDVWTFLAMAGEGRPFPAYKPNFDDTIAFYREANGGECVIVAGDSIESRRSACGSRFGCWNCACTEDKSMAELLKMPRYAYMEPLNRVQRFLLATQHDTSLRRWVGRRPHPETGHIPIHPNCYSAEMVEYLLRALLTADRREMLRARRFRDLVAAGRAEDDPGVQDLRTDEDTAETVEANVRRYIERMQEPQFQVITPEMLVTIDAYWSQDALHPPYHALAIWRDVYERGIETEVPDAEPVPRGTWPGPRWLEAEHEREDWSGDFAHLDTWSTIQDCGTFTMRPIREPRVRADGRVVRMASGDYGPQLDMQGAEAWTVDREALELFFTFEFQRCVDDHDHWEEGTLSRTTAFQRYLTLGVIRLGPSQTVKAEQMLARGRMFERHGLAGSVDPETLLKRTISNAEHEALVARSREWRERESARRDAADLRRYRRLIPGMDVRQTREVFRARERMREELPRTLARLIAGESFVTAHRTGRIRAMEELIDRAGLPSSMAAELAKLFQPPAQARPAAETIVAAVLEQLGHDSGLSLEDAEAILHRERQRDDAWRRSAARLAVAAIARVNGNGTFRLEGVDIEEQLAQLRAIHNDWRRASVSGPWAPYLAPLYARLVRLTYSRALTLLADEERVVELFRWGFGLGFTRYDVTAQAKAYKAAIEETATLAPAPEAEANTEAQPEAACQLELFAA